jgi:hypothetical protein
LVDSRTRILRRKARIIMMRIRLRLLLTSFNKSVMDYALARLEVALQNPGMPAPPVISRLGPSSRIEDGFGSKWPAALGQVGAAADYIAAGDRGALGVDLNLAWSRLARAVKMVGQFAESIEWIGVESRANAAGDDGT